MLKDKTDHYDFLNCAGDDRKTAAERLKRRVEELKALNEMSRSGALALSLDQVIESALDQVMETLYPDLVVLFLKTGDDLTLKGVRSCVPEFDASEATCHRVGKCLCGLAASADHPRFSLNIQEDDRCIRRECRAASIRSFASMPLLNRNQVVGVLGLGSQKERDFSRQSAFLQSVAALISIGVANALLHQRVRSHANELEAIVARRTAELKKLSNAVEHCPASIIITDPNGAIEYVNPFFSRLTGYSLEEARGQTPKILNSGHHDDAFFDNLWGTLLEKKTWRGEILNRKKDGSLYWESASLSPLLNEAGNITHFVAVKEDITEKKRAEKDLQESEARYKTIFHASRDGILVADQYTRQFLYANDSICKMLGYEKDELLTKSIRDIHPEADLSHVQAEFERQASGEIEFSPELPCKCKNGQVFFCDISAASVVIDDRPCVMGFFRDVSERIEAAKLREDVDRMMRHDLKSPLNGIIGVPQMLLMDDNLTDEQRSLLQGVMDAGHKMLGMINLSLTLYQIEKGVYQSESWPYDLLQLVNRCVEDNRTLAKSKQVTFCVLVDDDATRVMAQGEELLGYSIFSNLLLNAVEASPKGETVTVRINVGRYVKVSIHNKGEVPLPIQDRFFEKYASYGKQHGTGLGAYSAKLLAEVQGWSIDMETSQEKGTFLILGIPV